MFIARLQRIKAEVLNLAYNYESVLWDDLEGQWIMIEKFQLPHGFNKKYTSVLITLPFLYPKYPPNGIYVNKNLGIKSHYFENTAHNPFADKNWAWFCIKIENDDWKPKPSIFEGSNLLQLLSTFRNNLKQFEQDWMVK